MDEKELRKLIKDSIENDELNEDIGSWAKDKAQKTWDKTKGIGKAVGREAKETVTAARILVKLLKKNSPTPEEIKFLKGQSADLGKALAIIGLQAIPGSSVGIIALEKILQKYNLTLFPKAQDTPEGHL